MAALLMTTVVAPSSQTGCSALPIRKIGHGGDVDFGTFPRSSFGSEAVAGSSCLSGPSSGRFSALNVSCEDVSFGTIWKGSGRAGYATLSSKLPNEVHQTISSGVNGISSTMVSAVLEDVGVDKVVTAKSRIKKPEVISDAFRAPEVTVQRLKTGGPEKPVSVKDYMEQAPGFVQQSDTGPPRWFCPLDVRGSPPDAPILLFLPGLDSTGLGLLLHQQKLARLFEVQILHIPISDRTYFEGLVEIIEKRIREEYDRKPSPIYLLGESFGGCLALSVAARNPDLDLVFVLANPATSFARSPLQPYLPLLQWVPDELFRISPFLLSFTMGDPVRMASASVDMDLPPWERLPKLADALTDLLPTLPVLADILPRELIAWKVRLLNDASRYANARLRYVKSDILLLASGKDQMVPSLEEARRLKAVLPHIKARLFPNSGHTLLLEEGLNVGSLIKSAQLLRHKKNSKFDPITDFRFPFPDEIAKARSGSTRLIHQIFSPIFLSTTEDGKVRRGLPQLPEGKPLLFVSNHTLIGFDLGLVVEEFLMKKGILLRGLAHPVLQAESEGVEEPSATEVFKLFGTVPVSGNNLYRVLAKGEAALLYPGGVREALKRKGELYKLFWSESPEFVRTAIRHGAIIIPFASVGGDDIFEILLDTNDLLSLPILGESFKNFANQIPGARATGIGEVMKETFVAPLGLPKTPPRVYFLFKPAISTEGMLGSIKDKVAVEKLYKKVRGEVESGLGYLLEKRKEDPYRDLLPRVLYEATNDRQAPTFDH